MRSFATRMILTFLAALLAGCLPLPAANYEFRAGGMSLWFPDDWDVDITENTMTGFAAGREVILKLSLLTDARDLNAAFRKYPGLLAPEIRAYRETKAPRAVTTAGTEGLSAGGEGTTNGVKRSIRVLVFRAPRSFVLLTWSVIAEKSDQYQPIYDRIAGSIGPAR